VAVGGTVGHITQAEAVAVGGADGAVVLVALAVHSAGASGKGVVRLGFLLLERPRPRSSSSELFDDMFLSLLLVALDLIAMPALWRRSVIRELREY
jgi:hypothetical protein